jgi:biotin carboxyl carrier protein
VGELAAAVRNIDLESAWRGYCRASSSHNSDVLDAKKTLVLRPIERLVACPHTLSGWLSANKDAFAFENGRVAFAENPIDLLVDTYHFLNLDSEGFAAASEKIWAKDANLLETAEAFYMDASRALNTDSWEALVSCLEADSAENLPDDQWRAIQAAHAGHQAGLSLLLLLPAMAAQTGFYELEVNADLSIHIPDRLLDDDHQDAMAKALAPPPVSKSDEIVATSGGMFYGREAPGEPLYVEPGSTFKTGDPLFIVEVMKMFNKVNAPFDGKIDQVLVEGEGVIIKKGQPIFKVTPDEKPEDVSDEELAARRAKSTQELLNCVI